MEENVRKSLIDLNQRFYEQFGDSFSATREHVQAGVRKIAKEIPGSARILDLGCGNGRFLFFLCENGFRGNYTGIDFSAPLLKEAEKFTAKCDCTKSFIKADITDKAWDTGIKELRFDYVFAFAVLHHIPGRAAHSQLVRKIAEVLGAEGYFLFSTWQLQNSSRLLERILPWSTIGLRDEMVEAGDALLDWRAEAQKGKVGYRYVHRFTQDGLERLREGTPFKLVDSFFSDGKEGNLALYQKWQKFA